MIEGSELAGAVNVVLIFAFYINMNTWLRQVSAVRGEWKATGKEVIKEYLEFSTSIKYSYYEYDSKN